MPNLRRRRRVTTQVLPVHIIAEPGSACTHTFPSTDISAVNVVVARSENPLETALAISLPFYERGQVYIVEAQDSSGSTFFSHYVGPHSKDRQTLPRVERQPFTFDTTRRCRVYLNVQRFDSWKAALLAPQDRVPAAEAVVSFEAGPAMNMAKAS